jgi:methionyl-tRNA formyltransferase
MLRVVFMGTPDFALTTLAAIVAAGHAVVAVYTQPPRPAGRGMETRKSPVHAFASAAGVAVFTPSSLKAAPAQAQFALHGADVGIVVAYGLLLPKPVLDAPRHGCLNLHASLLPRWRGAAPIQRAIMAGDAMTAAAVMRMDVGLDTGPICLIDRVPIGADTTAGELHHVLAERGAHLMVQALAALERGSLTCTEQASAEVTYAPKLTKSEARLDFTRPAREVHNRVRGLSPMPGAWFETSAGGKPERIKVLKTILVDGSGGPGSVIDDALTVACGQGAVRLVALQRPGKRPMTAQEFLRGFALRPGAHL